MRIGGAHATERSLIFIPAEEGKAINTRGITWPTNVSVSNVSNELKSANLSNEAYNLRLRCREGALLFKRDKTPHTNN